MNKDGTLRIIKSIFEHEEAENYYQPVISISQNNLKI